MRTILGVDQSYTSSGYVVIDESGEVKEFGTIRTTVDTDGDTFDRAAKVAETVAHLANEHNPALVGFEGLAFSMMGNATRDLAGLQFVLVTQLRKTSFGSNLVIVSPNLLKKFATGDGKAKKEAMVAALPQTFLDAISERKFKKSTGLYDIADAYWIARYTLEELKKRNADDSVETKQP